jgi:RNA polymerase sigma-70 factor (ECF subfamily)
VQGADTDDAAQQVFLIALRKLDRIEDGKERSFLYGVAVRVARSRGRSRRRRRMEPLDAEELPSHTMSPHEAASRAEAWRRVHAALAGMAADAREVFVLHEIEELTTPAIARILGIPRGTVASRLRRARAAFRRAVSDDQGEERP